jgi:hypothetical protein
VSTNPPVPTVLTFELCLYHNILKKGDIFRMAKMKFRSSGGGGQAAVETRKPQQQQQNRQKQADDPTPKMTDHQEIELPENLEAAINWLEKTFPSGRIRSYVGTDGRDYGEVTPKLLRPPSDDYEDVFAVGERILERMKEVGQDYDMHIYATYTFNFDKKIAKGRFISSKNGKFYFALEIEHVINSAKAGIQSFQRRGNRQQDNDDNQDDSGASGGQGFGKF